MPRQPRIEYPGAHYHVMGRSNEGRVIFPTDYEHTQFLKALGEACHAYSLQLRAYVLMPNHYHLLVTTPEGNLSQAMAWLLTAFTVRYNKSHNRIGHVFQGRFKAQIIDDRTYARSLISYLHLNPIRSRIDGRPRITQPPELLENFPWSSHPIYLGRRKPPSWLNTEWLSFWGNDSSAHDLYREEIFALIRKSSLDDPWIGLQDGLILAQGPTLEEIRTKLRLKPGKDSVRLRQRDEAADRAKRVKHLAAKIENKNLRLWLLCSFTGQKKIDIAKENGLKSTASISSRLRTFQKQVAKNEILRRQMRELEKEFLQQLGSDPNI